MKYNNIYSMMFNIEYIKSIRKNSRKMWKTNYYYFHNWRTNTTKYDKIKMYVDISMYQYWGG